MTFADFGFEERIQKGIDEAGFKQPMPVQSECFNLLIKEHRDIYAQSQTGTGKTAAFLLAIFQLKITEEKYKDEPALIVVPTRELAVQIEREAKMLGKFLDYKVGSIYGGVGYGAQEKMLEQGADILIATPGRLLDFHKQRKLNLKDFGFLVIDEADRLFDMGFLPDLRRILKGMRPYNERHTLLFSATMNARVGNLAWEYMNDPGEVIIEPEKVTVDTVTQELYHVGKDEKMKLLLGILKRDEPENAVIFTNTRHSAWEVAKRMEVNGYAVEFLMGDLPQSKRLRIVDEVKKGRHKFLVATDVAARGLHIDDLQMVINYDVPLEAESYVHRIGRTARAGAEGKTVTLACEEYVYGLSPIEKLLGEKIPVSWADESLLVEDKSEGRRFPPQDRYRELGGDRNGGRPGGSRDRDRGGRDDRYRNDDRGRHDDRSRRDDRGRREEPRGDGRTRGPQKSTSPGARSHKSGQGPSGGKKPLDPRAAKIQSVVSSVAGGSIDDFGRTGGGRKDGSRQDKRSGKPGSAGSRNRSDNRKNESSRSGASKRKSPKERSDRAGERAPRMTDGERVSSKNSIDERLEYYRKKYGEDFTMNDSSGKSSSSKKKKGPKSGGKRKPSHRGSGNPAGGNPTKRVDDRDGEAQPSTDGKKRGSDSSDGSKKGFISKLFGGK